MPKDSFKTRLEIAKKKIKKNKNNQKNQKTSNFGEAFKMSTELVACSCSWDNYWVYFGQLVWY